MFIQAQSTPDTDQWRHHHAKAEEPYKSNHKKNVKMRVDSAVVGMAGDQNVAEKIKDIAL